MPRYLVVSKTEDGTTQKLAEVNEESHAINHLTDAVYTALVDGNSIEIAATRTDGQVVRRFAHIIVRVDEMPDDRTYTGTLCASHTQVHSP